MAARTTRKTQRRYPPLARKLLEQANELDRSARALRTLAEKVATAEADAEAGNAYRAHFETE